MFLENEQESSAYSFEVADTDALFDLFRKSVAESENCLSPKSGEPLPIPAYEQAIKASHTFNLLQARGVISVAERQAYIGRVRDLAKGACAAWMTKRRVERMTDFLLELRSEEIPARMQARAREDLARLFAAELAKAGLTATDTTTYATPRRLTLIARGLPDATQAVSEEVKGPKIAAPPQALDGFLRKTSLTREQLTERDGVLFAITEKPGRATAQVLAEAIPAIIRAFPWPKSMRWGEASISTDSLRWVRPLHGIVALFGTELVPVEIAGIQSGYATLGHRFHHAGPITIGSAADYVEKLRACHVIVDQDERAALIRTRAQDLAATEAGLTLVEDEGLVAENAGLTEWPVPLLGRFDADFLSVPPEVIQLTARVNQKYFVCRDRVGAGGGALANAFLCTANIAAPDGGAKIVEGNRKVLAARLADARFFYEQDAKVRLEDHAKKLDRIVFHEKLGTVADKVERVAKLARWLVEEGIVTESPSRLREGLGEGVSVSDAPSVSTTPPPTPPASGRGEYADLAERAARLCKADLVTGMVGEFPELQGVMGGYYAQAQGEDPRVAASHPRPLQAGRPGRRSADRAGDGGGEFGGQAGYAWSASFAN